MKNIFPKMLLLVFFFALTQSSSAQKTADKIIGKWYTENNKSVVEIYKKDNKYYGKMIHLKDPNEADGTAKLDKNNPDDKLKKRPLLGLVLMTELVYDEDNEWEDGEIYDPESGSTYSCMVTLVDNDKIEMRGYIGFSMFGRSTTWVRKKN